MITHGDPLDASLHEPRRVRLLRGQVVVREIGANERSVILQPDPDQNDVQIHRGRVIAMGAPALNCKTDDRGRCTSITCRHVEVPHGFKTGDEVIYVFVHHREAWTRNWTDGKLATWVPQSAIQGIVVL